MSTTYLATNVFEEALNRIRFIYDNCDDVIVNMSGGKDSTVVFELAKIVARERGRLPIKVFWLDQEAEWQATADYMKNVMYSEEVKPYWLQIPFQFTNSLSFKNNFLHVWDPKEKENWIREQDPISIKVNPTKRDRFHELMDIQHLVCEVEDKKHAAILVGMRTTESQNRRICLSYGNAKYKGINWCKKPVKNTRVFWPIYDFTDQDIWTAIAKNHWKYNKVYDYFYKYGVVGNKMRVSALIHETAWHSIEMLQEVEPVMYNKYINRIIGISCFNHFKKEIMPKELPPYFKDWQEYRDYLLVNLTDPKYHELFRRRWNKQLGEEWAKVHVKEIMVNDIDGTLNGNAKRSFELKEKSKKGGQYYNQHEQEFEKFMSERGMQ